MIHEYYTSKCCSACGEEMVFVGERTMGEHAATLAKKGMGVTKRPIHGVLKCLKCNASGAECETGLRKHWHRDVNAAVNIGKIFTTCLAEHDERPWYLKLPGGWDQ